MSTISLENYLKTIYHLSDGGRQLVSTQGVSRALNYSKPAITDMAKKMKKKGLLNYIPYKGMKLTEEGMVEALRIIRIHRLWETFLIDTLGYTWQDVHEEAERLEHSTSDKLADRLAAFLGNPVYDPHGAPIPNAMGQWPAPLIDLMRLDNVFVPGNYTIKKVEGRNPDFMEIITDMGLLLNTELTLVQHRAFDLSKRVRIGERETMISKEISQRIYVNQQV